MSNQVRVYLAPIHVPIESIDFGHSLDDVSIKIVGLSDGISIKTFSDWERVYHPDTVQELIDALQRLVDQVKKDKNVSHGGNHTA